MKAPKLVIVDVPIDHIEVDPDNVNEMSEEQFRALRDEVRLRGFMQPVLIREVEVSSAKPAVRYRVIDGEHRLLVLGELGAETVPCVIEPETDDDEAKVRSLMMNRLRGSFVPIKYAHLLADLAERVPTAELQSRLAMDKGELDGLLDLAGYLEPEDPEKPERETPERPAGVEIAVVATREQAGEIEKLLAGLTGEDPEKNAAVVARKAREYVAAK